MDVPPVPKTSLHLVQKIFDGYNHFNFLTRRDLIMPGTYPRAIFLATLESITLILHRST